MESLFNVNGLMFWSDREIRIRQQFIQHYAAEFQSFLLSTNPAWTMIQVEAPLLTPKSLINPNYESTDVWFQESNDQNDISLVLRPETTPGTYVYAQHMFKHQKAKPPYCVWQAGKSFRREADSSKAPSKHVRLKEFYQQEFQAIFTEDTANDYHTLALESVRKMVAESVSLPTRMVVSDRLPSYSIKTMDIEVDNGDKWMEVCSISLRTDFPDTFTFLSKKGPSIKKLLVLEVAIGLDRCVYNYNSRVV